LSDRGTNLIYAVALTTDDLGVVLEIAGGLSATALAFIVCYCPITIGHTPERR
jgi:hypothetical protein